MKWSFFLLCIFSLGFSEIYEDTDVQNTIELGDSDDATADIASVQEEDVYYPTRLDLGGFYLYQHKASRKKNAFFAEADLFIPLFQNRDNVFFIDLRIEEFQGSPFEGNFGLGFRHIFDTWMFGIYSFYDRKRSENRNYFNQITIGTECKTDKFTFDANAYIPFGKTSIFDPNFNKSELRPGVGPFQNIWFVDGREAALWGFDAEVGYRFFGELSLFLGGFYFHKNNVDTVAGPFARLNWAYYFNSSVLNYIGLESGYSYDNVRKSRFYGGLKISFFLGGEKSNRPKGLKRRMVEYVRRDYDVVAAGNRDAPFERLNHSDGSPYTVIIAENLTELNTAIGNDPDVIGLDGTATGGGASTLMDDQFFTGGIFNFGDHGQEIRLSDGGTIENGIVLGKNNTVRDLTFKDVQLKNDLSSHVGTLFVENVNFENTSAIPLEITIDASGTNSNITIQNSTFNVTSTRAIAIERQENGALTVKAIENNTINFTATVAIDAAILIRNGFIATSAGTQTINLGTIMGNTITVDTGGFDLVKGIYINNFIIGPVSMANQEILGGSILNNTITVNKNISDNSDAGISLLNETTDAPGGISQKMNINQMDSNLIISSGDTLNTGIILSNFETDPVAATPQEIIVGEILQNNITVGTTTGLSGMSLLNGGAAVTSSQTITAGFDGGFFENQIQLNGTGDDIRLTNDNASGVIDIKVDFFGQDLSDANNGAGVVKTGTNIPGITITP